MSKHERNGVCHVDDGDVVTIDRSNDAERYRYRCPNGHSGWSRTNSHLWCRGCRRRIEQGDDSIDAEHYEILDTKEDVLIPFEQVTIK